MSLRHIFLALFMFPVCIFAGISGTYQVEGFDPASDSTYTGTVAIAKVGEVYTAHWTFSTSTDMGTGVRKGDTIAFVFTESTTDDSGVQLYKIKGRTLEGPWVRQGTAEKGFERATKVRTGHSG